MMRQIVSTCDINTGKERVHDVDGGHSMKSFGYWFSKSFGYSGIKNALWLLVTHGTFGSVVKSSQRSICCRMQGYDLRRWAISDSCDFGFNYKPSALWFSVSALSMKRLFERMLRNHFWLFGGSSSSAALLVGF
jgi:hypothetical protein